MAFLDLFKPKWKHSNLKIRVATVENLTDQKVLIDIVKNDKNSTVRKTAVENLTDQKVLADITKNDKYDYHVRKAAKERLYNI